MRREEESFSVSCWSLSKIVLAQCLWVHIRWPLSSWENWLQLFIILAHSTLCWLKFPSKVPAVHCRVPHLHRISLNPTTTRFISRLLTRWMHFHTIPVYHVNFVAFIPRNVTYNSSDIVSCSPQKPVQSQNFHIHLTIKFWPNRGRLRSLTWHIIHSITKSFSQFTHIKRSFIQFSQPSPRFHTKPFQASSLRHFYDFSWMNLSFFYFSINVSGSRNKIRQFCASWARSSLFVGRKTQNYTHGCLPTGANPSHARFPPTP